MIGALGLFFYPSKSLHDQYKNKKKHGSSYMEIVTTRCTNCIVSPYTICDQYFLGSTHTCVSTRVCTRMCVCICVCVHLNGVDIYGAGFLWLCDDLYDNQGFGDTYIIIVYSDFRLVVSVRLCRSL